MAQTLMNESAAKFVNRMIIQLACWILVHHYKVVGGSFQNIACFLWTKNLSLVLKQY